MFGKPSLLRASASLSRGAGWVLPTAAFFAVVFATVHTNSSSVTAIAAPAAATSPTPDAAAAEFFENRIRPVLATQCYSCHGPDAQLGGLRVDSREALLTGGKSGPALVPGDPAKSLVVLAVQQTGKLKMPMGGHLKTPEIAAVVSWVKDGALWPVPNAAKSVSPGEYVVSPAQKKFWSFQPVKNSTPPVVHNKSWPQSDLDKFILAKLEAKGLTPAGRADKHTLLRRVTFDLTGLPPTAAEIESFMGDTSPGAFAHVVDRLLASPNYGECWARHWMDVARYADTKGYVFAQDRNYPNAYTYRDWLIDSFNRNLPYDEFVKEQIAADRLPGVAKDSPTLAAMGFLTMGRRFLDSEPDIVNDRIDVTMRGFEGLTVSCARCHDHKFDPIPTKDYYSLYGMFASSKEVTPEIQGPGLAPGKPRIAMAMQDNGVPVQQHIFKRGNQYIQGDLAPPRFLQILSPPVRPIWSNGSGRLELAEAIASPSNPLTARVFVNRVWMYHFGFGLVRSPSDFGKQGERPTHPELLDYLASSFMKSGWDIKKLQRQIVLTSAYQMADDLTSPRAAMIDPENRLLSHQNRHRLEFEPMRDALLWASGQLDRTTIGGPSVDLWTRPYPPRRSVYGFIDRQNLPGIFRTFDLASPDTTSPKRFQTTVPQQALFFLNSPFVAEQARAIAAQPYFKGLDDKRRVGYLYLRLFGRMPSSDEVAIGTGYVHSLRSNPTKPAPPVWQYGYGLFDPVSKRTKTFTTFGTFSAGAWHGGAVMPDPVLHYVSLNADGGHPGMDAAHAAIRRWTAPQSGTYRIDGSLNHPAEQGDGVRARIVSSRAGLLGEWIAHHAEVPTAVANVSVQKGDTLDFVVDCRDNEGFDSFAWSPTISVAGGKSWRAKQEFAGPDQAYLAMQPWENYAQALMMTNEFVYID